MYCAIWQAYITYRGFNQKCSWQSNSTERHERWNAWRLRHGVAKATIVFNGCAHAAARRAANNTKAFVPRSRNRLTNIHFVYSLFKQVQPPTGIKRERVWNRVSCSSQNRACYKGDISGDHCKPTRKYGNTSTQILYTKHNFFRLSIWEKTIMTTVYTEKK